MKVKLQLGRSLLEHEQCSVGIPSGKSEKININEGKN